MVEYIIYFMIGLLWIASLIIVRRDRGPHSFLTTVFQSNKDLDTTLNIILRAIITISALAIVVIYFSMFHAKLDGNDVGMLGMHVIGMAGVTLTAVMNGHHSNGKDKKDESS